MKSIKLKLILFFTTLIIIITSVTGYFANVNARKSVTKEVERALELLAKNAVKLTESEIEGIFRELEMLANSPQLRSLDWDQQQELLRGERIRLKRYVDFGIYLKDGSAKFSNGDGVVRLPGQDQLELPEYVQEAFEGKRSMSDLIFSDVESKVSQISNKGIIIFAVPIYVNKKVEAVLIARTNSSSLNNIIEQITFGESGLAYIIGKNGELYAYPDESLLVKRLNLFDSEEQDLKQWGNAINKLIEKEGVTQYQKNGENKYLTIAEMPTTGWLIGVETNVNEALTEVDKMKLLIGLVTFLAIVIGIVLAYLIGQSITKPIIKTEAYAEKVHHLDLTKEVPKELLNRKDEIGNLATAFSKVVISLKRFILLISDASSNLTTASSELLNTSEVTTNSSEELAKTIQEIASNASKQAVKTESGVINATKMGNLIDREQSYVTNLLNKVNIVSDLKDEGVEVLASLVNSTKTTVKVSKEVEEVIQITNINAEEISKVSRMIRSISEETNLLALNAAIEAARAGEYGKGFAVVADEVRKLAEQSGQFSKEIDRIVQDLKDQSSHAVELMKQASIAVEKQNSNVFVTRQKFEGITLAIEDIIKGMRSLEKATLELKVEKNQVLGVMEDIVSIAQGNAASSEEAAASTEEQTAAMEQIAIASEKLSTLAFALKEEIEKFTY